MKHQEAGVFSHYLAPSEMKHFEKQFNENPGATYNEIPFDSFKDIVMAYSRFNKVVVNTCLDKIKKKVKEITSSQSDKELVISFKDYLEYIEVISLEQDRTQNERDPEIKNLFYLLSCDGPVIYRKKLVEIINDFELPILLEDFFYPIGKKEEINLSDFCCLFRAKGTVNDFYFKTFASSFYNSNVSVVPAESAKTFPIQVIPK